MASVEARLNVFNIIRRERRLPRPRVFRDRTNPLEDMEHEEVFERYRFKPETIIFLVEILYADLARPTRRNSALPPLIQILVALRFLATGSFYILVGEPLGIAKSTAGRAVRHVCFLLARLAQSRDTSHFQPICHYLKVDFLNLQVSLKRIYTLHCEFSLLMFIMFT